MKHVTISLNRALEAIDASAFDSSMTSLHSLDLSDNGRQPMKSASGRWIVLFNGEIYNHLNIRSSIMNSMAISWRGSSDTETLTELIEFFGFEKALPKIDGMFAIAAWDKKLNKLFPSSGAGSSKSPENYTEEVLLETLNKIWSEF